MDKGYPGDRARRLCILLSCSFISLSPESYAGGFFEDSTLTGDVYYWQRERDRKEPGQGHYQTNLSHGTWNGQLDFSSAEKTKNPRMNSTYSAITIAAPRNSSQS